MLFKLSQLDFLIASQEIIVIYLFIELKIIFAFRNVAVSLLENVFQTVKLLYLFFSFEMFWK